MDLVEISGLSVSYGDKRAISSVSLVVPPGRIIAVVGVNGAGKTTLLRALFGEVPMTEGNIRVCGLNPFDLRDRRRLWSVARWVGDTSYLYEELTVRENLEFLARVYGVPDRQVAAATENVMLDLDLTSVAHERVKRLSFGTQHKVHIASGFFSGANGPRLAVFDEPTTGLDPPSRAMLMRVMAQYVKPNDIVSERSLLISSHNLSELSAIADSIVMLNAGSVVAVGPVDEIAARDESSLQYDIRLFDAHASQLAADLQAALSVYCDVKDRCTVSLTCDSVRKVAELMQYLGRSDKPFRVREVRERLTVLERVFQAVIEENVE